MYIISCTSWCTLQSIYITSRITYEQFVSMIHRAMPWMRVRTVVIVNNTSWSWWTRVHKAGNTSCALVTNIHYIEEARIIIHFCTSVPAMHTLESESAAYIPYTNISPSLASYDVLDSGTNNSHTWSLGGLNSPTVLYKRPNLIRKAPFLCRLRRTRWTSIIDSHLKKDSRFSEVWEWSFLCECLETGFSKNPFAENVY